eukprot:TRINITY_DN3252_c0_g1_i1.p1 TRINITY_DN3252_c0_g1~~TRINITY_DN3252_c0_g1_i1.p1  ORF type:complete len:252 (-),score=33.93 TRINITY_DN3252_c0_g1_i1:108-863(-)
MSLSQTLDLDQEQDSHPDLWADMDEATLEKTLIKICAENEVSVLELHRKMRDLKDYGARLRKQIYDLRARSVQDVDDIISMTRNQYENLQKIMREKVNVLKKEQVMIQEEIHRLKKDKNALEDDIIQANSRIIVLEDTIHLRYQNLKNLKNVTTQPRVCAKHLVLILQQMRHLFNFLVFLFVVSAKPFLSSAMYMLSLILIFSSLPKCRVELNNWFHYKSLSLSLSVHIIYISTTPDGKINECTCILTPSR